MDDHHGSACPRCGSRNTKRSRPWGLALIAAAWSVFATTLFFSALAGLAIIFILPLIAAVGCLIPAAHRALNWGSHCRSCGAKWDHRAFRRD